jgi:4-amino-4-deoxy-L-arabinose transferase-like glycosyltransferase
VKQMWLALSRIERLYVVGLLSLALFELCLIGVYPILDKSEARYALVALRMVLSGDWVTPTIDGVTPFWGKPPLAFWTTALSIGLFGANEFAVRLPMLLTVAATAALTIDLGRQGRDRAFGLLGGSIFASMLLPLLMAGFVLTDQMLTFGITLAMVSFWRAMTAPGRLAGYLLFVGLAIAILTKGLVGLALAGPALLIWLILNKRFADAFRILPLFSGGALMIALALPWYVLAEWRTPGFLYYFIVGEHLMKFLKPGWTGDRYGVGRGGSSGWVWLFVMTGTLPWSICVAEALARPSLRAMLPVRQALADPWIRFLLLWAVVPLIFFTFAGNVGLPYVLPMLPPIALLIAQMLRYVGREGWPRYIAFGLAANAVTLSAVVGAVQLSPTRADVPTQKYIIALWRELGRNPDQSIMYLDDKPYSADFYTLAKARQARGMDEALRAQDQKFLAILSECLIAIPEELRTQYEFVGERNRTALLWAREDALKSSLYNSSLSRPWPTATAQQVINARQRCMSWSRYN